jgi:hypothetical protein
MCKSCSRTTRRCQISSLNRHFLHFNALGDSLFIIATAQMRLNRLRRAQQSFSIYSPSICYPRARNRPWYIRWLGLHWDIIIIIIMKVRRSFWSFDFFNLISWHEHEKFNHTRRSEDHCIPNLKGIYYCFPGASEWLKERLFFIWDAAREPKHR